MLLMVTYLIEKVRKDSEFLAESYRNNIFYPLIHTQQNQGVRNFTFSKIFAYVLNE